MINTFRIIDNIVEIDVKYKNINLIAVIDLDDLAKVSRINSWTAFKGVRSNTYYAKAYIRNSRGTFDTILMHRLILSLKANDKIITDHKNKNGLDNRKVNIVATNGTINNLNRDIETGKYIGISWNRKQRKYNVKIKREGETIWIGSFHKISIAREARIIAENIF